MKHYIKFRKGATIFCTIACITWGIILIAIIVLCKTINIQLFSVRNIAMLIVLILYSVLTLYLASMLIKQQKNSFLYYTESKIVGKYIRLPWKKWEIFTRTVSVDYNLNEVSFDLIGSNLKIIHNKNEYLFPIKNAKETYQKLLEAQNALHFEG